jgi:hypothetical protein
MRSATSRRLVAAVLGLVLAAAATPARAAVEPPAHTDWSPVSCAAGELTAHVDGPSEVWVSGWIEPCPRNGPPALATFSVGYYLSTRTAARGRDLYYESPTGRSAFGGRLENGYFSQLVAVCLTFSATGRVACLAVEPTADWVTVVPIGIDDPRVAMPLPPGSPGQPGQNPTCGNCV